jgi:hypothetical protein
MNPEITSANNAALLFDAANAIDLPHRHSLGIDRALGIEEASLASVVRFNSSVLDFYWNTACLAPLVAQLIDAALQAFGFSVELQMAWLNLIAPHPWQWLPLASNSGRQTYPPADVLERSMDIAIGGRAA